MHEWKGGCAVDPMITPSKEFDSFCNLAKATYLDPISLSPKVKRDQPIKICPVADA